MADYTGLRHLSGSLPKNQNSFSLHQLKDSTHRGFFIVLFLLIRVWALSQLLAFLKLILHFRIFLVADLGQD